MIKYAIGIHLAMICFMYTNKRLLTPLIYNKEKHYRPNKERTDRFLQRRYDETCEIIVLWACITLVILFIIYKLIVKVCLKVYKKDKAKGKLKEVHN